MAFRRDRRLLWPPSPVSPVSCSPPLPIACHMIFGRCLAAGCLLFKCALAQCGFLWASLSGFVLCFIFWVPVVVVVVVVCTLWELPPWPTGWVCSQAASLYYNILRLHFAFCIYFLLCTSTHSRLLSFIPSKHLSLNCCISLHFTAWHLRWLIKGHAQCQDSLELLSSICALYATDLYYIAALEEETREKTCRKWRRLSKYCMKCCQSTE